MGLAVEGPAFAILFGEVLIGFGDVGDLAFDAVVFEFFADAVGDQTEQHLLDHVGTVIEVAGGFEAWVFAGVQPLFLEVTERRQGIFGFAFVVVSEVSVVAEREEDAGVEVGDEEAFGAFEHGTVADLGEVEVGFWRAGHSTTLIPTDGDRAAPIVGRVLEVGLAFDGGDIGIKGLSFGFCGGG